MEQDQGYYEPPVEDPSNVTSLHAEMLRSRDYGDSRFYPDYHELRTTGQYWAGELKDERRSERAKKDIYKLLGRISFELVCRQNDLIKEELYGVGTEQEA